MVWSMWYVNVTRNTNLRENPMWYLSNVIVFNIQGVHMSQMVWLYYGECVKVVTR